MAGGRRMRVRFALLRRHIAALISIVLAVAGLTFISAPAAQAAPLNANTSVFQITFTGITSLPNTQTIVSPVGIQAAWTLNGAQPTDANFIDVTNRATALYTVRVPTSGTNSGGASIVPATILSTDTVMLTLRDNPNDVITASLGGYLGNQSVNTTPGQKSSENFLADHSSSAGNVNGKELISFGQFAGFKYLQDAFIRIPSSFVISAELPASVTDLSNSFGTQSIVNANIGNGTGISGWDVSNVTNFSNMFNWNTGFNQDLSSWDTSSATNMSKMFTSAARFNQPIDSWDVGNVTDFSYMFQQATIFNQPLGSWNTSSATDMSYMFHNARAFNQPINFNQQTGSWNTSNVTNMSNMFNFAQAFNQPIGSWNTSSVTNMSSMFLSSVTFNQPIGTWDVSDVTDMSSMFKASPNESPKFNQNLSSWNTSAVTNMNSMFFGADVFNNGGALGTSLISLTWDTSSVTNMADMFNTQYSFNQPIDTWDVRNVTNMSSMFSAASAFNQPLNSWDTSSVTTMSYMFGSSSRYNQPIGNWDTSSVTNMSQMFSSNTAFNQDIHAWDTRNVTTFSNMFSGTSSFNNGLAAGNSSRPLDWNTPRATTMAGMFSGAIAFNQSVNSFNTSSVTSIANMFSGATSFNQPVNSWNTTAVTSFYGFVTGATSFNQSLGSFDLTRGSGTSSGAPIVFPASMSDANVQATFIGWAATNIAPNLYVSGGNQHPFSDCTSYAAYTSLAPVSNPKMIVTSGTFAATSTPVCNPQPGAPTINSITVGDKQLSVAFTAGTTGTFGAISKYQYSTDGSNWVDATGTTSPLVLTVVSSGSNANLVNGTAYGIRIRAYNGQNGNASASISATPEVAPGAPTITGITAGDQQLTVSFTEGSNSGSAITKYQYSTDGTSWKDVLTTTTPLVITTDGSNNALVNGTSYNVQIRAFNSLAGIASTAMSERVGVPPASPSGVVAMDINNPGSVLVYWTAPASPNLTDFKVEYTTNPNGSWTTATHSSSTATTLTVSGLTNGSTYYFRVSALNGSLSSAPALSSTTVYIRYPQVPLAWVTQNSSLPAFGTLALAVSGGSGLGALAFTTTSSGCTVSGNILTVGNAGSSCTVSVSKGADNTYGSINIGTSLVITVVKQNQATTPYFTNANSMSYGQTLKLDALGGSGIGNLSYAVDNVGATGCTLNPSTRVLSVTSTGTCRVSVQRAASTNYFISTVGYQDITVNPAPQTISFTSNIPTSPLAGGTYTPTATSSAGLAVAIAIQSGNCSIAQGVVSFTGSGNCVVKASQAGATPYAAATTIYQTVSVGQRNQLLQFTSVSRAIAQKTFGDSAFQVEATSTESAAVVTYSLGSASTSGACAVTSAGLVTVSGVGNCVVEANSASTGAFAAASPVHLTIPFVSDIASAPFVTSASAGNQAITLSFTAPGYTGGSSVTGYQVVAIPQSGSTGNLEESGCSPTPVNGVITCTVRGLEIGVGYKLKVAAINAAGVGAYSALSNELLATTNPSAVQNLNVVQDNAQLIIGWSDPDSLGGGTFQEYRIFVKRSTASNYDLNNYFVVNDNTLHTLTVQKVSPTGALLVNGVGYDIKVVTVTTANSSELTANTAVVNQIPRTVPFAPRFSSAFILGSSIVLTWETPESDGGAPISAYSASVESSPCTFATVTDTFCTVPVPRSSYTVDFEVMAVNVAGQSIPATGTLQISVPPVVTPPTQTDTQVSGGTSAFTQLAPLAVTEPIVTVHQDTTPQATTSSQSGQQSSGKAKSSSVLAQQPMGMMVALWVLLFLIVGFFLFLIVRRSRRKDGN